ncbi:MAG: gas vesicle protein [Nocardioidaceae bacterium]
MNGPTTDARSGRADPVAAGGRSAAVLSSHGQPQSLADVLERVLDKGIVIVGDIQIRLLDIELLTIKLRLLIASVDKAKEMGINWWEADEFATVNGDKDGKPAELTQRVEALEEQLGDRQSKSRSRSKKEQA